MMLLAIFGVLLLALLGFMAALLWRYPGQVVFVVTLSTSLMDCLQIGQNGINLGVLIYADDITCFVLLAAGLVVVLQKRTFPPFGSWPMVFLLLLAMLNFSRGASAFGVKPAGNAVRTLVCLIAPSLGLMLLQPVLRLAPERAAKWLTWAGSGFALVAMCRWIGVLPMPAELISEAREIIRAVGSDETMVIGQALIAITYLQLTRGIRWWGIALAGSLFLTVVALQHRSVWTATLVGLGWLGIRTSGVSRSTWTRLAVAAMVCLTLVVAALSVSVGIDRVIAAMQVNIDEVQQKDSTWTWRVQGWTEAIDRVASSDLFEMMLGPPAGTEFPGASFASVHIHNRYIDTLAYYGVLGVLVLLSWFILIARRIGGWTRVGKARDVALSRSFLQALLLSQIVYLIPYFGGILQGWVFGVLGLAAASRLGSTVRLVKLRAVADLRFRQTAPQGLL